MKSFSSIVFNKTEPQLCHVLLQHDLLRVWCPTWWQMSFCQQLLVFACFSGDKFYFKCLCVVLSWPIARYVHFCVYFCTCNPVLHCLILAIWWWSKFSCHRIQSVWVQVSCGFLAKSWNPSSTRSDCMLDFESRRWLHPLWIFIHFMTFMSCACLRILFGSIPGEETDFKNWSSAWQRNAGVHGAFG